MHARDINEFPSPSTIRKHEEVWEKVELPGGADDSYVCIRAKTTMLTTS